MRKHNYRHNYYRHSLGTITDDGWGTETAAEWEARKAKAYADYQKGLSSTTDLDKIIAEREAKRQAEQDAKYSTVKPNLTPEKVSTILSQPTQQSSQEKTSALDRYLKSGQAITDMNAILAKNKEEIKANQENVFSQNPDIAKKYAFNKNSGVYEPKPEAKDNTLLYAGIFGGLVVLGTVVYFVTKN